MEKKVRAVIFDMDGVIFDSEKLVMECWKKVARRHGIENIEKAAIACLGITREMSREVFRKHYGPDFPYDERKAEMSAYFHEQASGGRLALKPGVRELLGVLKLYGIRTALATSTRRAVAEREIIDAGLRPYFDILICGDMVTHSKPHPEIFLKALSELGVSAEEALVVEDSFNGVRAAWAGGIRAVMVPDLAEPDEEIRGKAWRVVPDLYEIRQMILKENKQNVTARPRVRILQRLEGAREAVGLTVIIDVFRAFTVEAYMAAGGASRILLCGQEKTVRELKETYPDWMTAGERGGRRIEGFDLGNSPTAAAAADLRGRILVHTTSAGTQGVAAALGADEILTGSLVNARAVADYILKSGAKEVSLVCMGLEGKEETYEDTLCARYIRALVLGEAFDLAGELARLRTESCAQKFFDEKQQEVFPASDFGFCTRPDLFGFVLKAGKIGEDLYEAVRIDTEGEKA